MERKKKGTLRKQFKRPPSRPVHRRPAGVEKDEEQSPPEEVTDLEGMTEITVMALF